MHRKFIATITAASIALTAIGTAPAFAENPNRTAQTIAALLGLAVVGTIIHENRKDKKRDQQVRLPTPVHNPPKYQRPVHNPPVYQPKPRPLPERVNRRLLPQQCLRSVQTYDGRARFFGGRCLQRHYQFAHKLPRACEYTFRTQRGDRRGYEVRCLRDRGFRLARG